MDYRPTQAEVDEAADLIFGEGWKDSLIETKEKMDAIITANLDVARRVVILDHKIGIK
jgi:hypothetical protein